MREFKIKIRKDDNHFLAFIDLDGKAFSGGSFKRKNVMRCFEDFMDEIEDGEGEQ